MKDIWNDLIEWTDRGEPFSVARVIQTWKSAPRSTGAGMIIGSNMEIAGSVSGGCIEGAVIEEALDVLKNGSPRKLSYGVEDELALSLGLSCGGEVSVFVEKHWAFSEQPETQAIWNRLCESQKNNEPAILLTRINSLNKIPKLVYPEGTNFESWNGKESKAHQLALEAYHARENRLVKIDGDEVFIHIFPRKDQLLVIGAGHITIPLIQFAQVLDFQTVVIDPRKVFASKDRFPVAPDHLIPKWPEDVLPDWPIHEDTYAILLTHDPKIDDPALKILLKYELPYVGALGSRRTHAKRCERMEQAGISKEKISSIKGPAGLDIKAQTAGELALSMLSEVIAAKRNVLD